MEPDHTSSELTGSEEQYRLLGANDPGNESDEHLPLPARTMGSDTADAKTEERQGDKVAYLAALGSMLVFICLTWYITAVNDPASLGWFPVHPVLQSLGLGCFTYGILTLQPTTHPKTKAAGLKRHQRTMLAVGVPCIALGTLAIEIHKFNEGHRHFVTWHGVFGLISVVWLVGQVVLGGGSVWFGGVAFGGRMKAKMLWKYHRLSGYVLFPLLLITAHLGGTWSTWVASHTRLWMRLAAYTVAPTVTLAAIYVRVRTSKMRFF